MSPSPAKSAELPRRRRLVMHLLDRNQPPHSASTDVNPPLASANPLQDDPQDQKGSSAIAQRQRVNRSSNALSLQAKYGLAEDDHHNDISGNNGHVHDHEKHIQQHANDSEITISHHDAQMKGSSSRLPLRTKYNSPANDNQHFDFNKNDRYLQHDTNSDPTSHHEVASTEHPSKRGGRIAESALRAAQAQAAELRALHSAVINSHNSLGADVLLSRRPMPVNNHLVHQKGRANKKESKIHNHMSGFKEMKEDVHGGLSSASSASSTADCFIRPLHEYPVFIPHSNEDMLTTSGDDMNSLNRRSSVDTFEAAMLREERLHYIFDHENKRSFSGSQFDDHYARENIIHCLHESLNLPPRSAALLMHVREKDDHHLHHMSLNLPKGSQHHLFKSSMQNPLFDSQSMHIKKKPSHHLEDWSDYSPSFKTYNDNLQGKPLKGNKAANYVDANETPLQDFTSRQRALIEFLSEEPTRMRAFNELAAKEGVSNSDMYPTIARMPMPKQKKIIQEDIVLPTCIKHTDKFESSANWNVDENQSSTAHHHHYQKPREPAIASIPQMRQRLTHTLQNRHLQQASSISFDKCRPTGEVPAVLFPLTDSSGAGANNSATNVAEVVTKDRPDQLKKPSIKGWFFRSKKKQNNADHNNPAYPPSEPASASKNHTPVTSGTFSVSKEQHSVASTTAPTPAPISHVFSGLATSETEKELEVAMAMDLMELKVLQANTKRDAAMAEVLELRLSMDSMAKKLVDVERHCESLKTQLLNVQSVQQMQLSVDRNAAIPVSGIFDDAVDLWMKPPVAEDGDEAGAADRGYEGALTDAEDDFCESDSHDNREERKAAASKVRAGLMNMQSSRYGEGRSSSSRARSMTQPKKEEFLSAVAEARVGVKQVSRVLLQHVQENMGTGLLVEMEGQEGEAAEQWRPILMMCREARKAEKRERGESSSSRSRDVGYCIEALISLAFYEHFENVGFDKNGAHHILDPAQRALAFYHSFLKLAKLTPTQLLTQSSALYNAAFDRFCSRKMRALGRAVGCPGRLWPDELARSFLAAARAVWLLHQLAFAYPACPPAIFRVAAHSPFDARFMELLPTHHLHRPATTLHHHHRLVSLMVMPGFFLYDDIIKCKVLA
ncbi:hypothetical protein GOP47_0010041 [Adiantum capillus-veneris]|uniref:Uncharacterized protein n=1 Tax=Adiantum capillus-veneris TaxID=13818 RepID=A0A9D4ZIB5_ADICA|nr:hypothetical protein GOP47_0010041 [Adiantum capillus-veneris]